MQVAQYFAGIARYHAWVTARLLDSLSTLGDEEWHRDSKLFFGSIHRTVNHLLVTDNIWFARFAENHSLRMALDTELHKDRAALVAAWSAAVQRWAPWIATLDATRFDGDLVYTRSDGEAMRIPFTPALGHHFNHATHHRGQLSAAITAMGRPGPVLDWVYLLQQEARSA